MDGHQKTHQQHPKQLGMKLRSIEWLKQQQINKRFTICRESDRPHVNDSNFEDWIVTDAMKHASTWGGDGFSIKNEDGFNFCGQPTPRPDSGHADRPFPYIEPVYTCFFCPWENVTAVYEGADGWIYIFTGDKAGS